MDTPAKTEMDPEKRWLEDYFPVEMVAFQEKHLNFRVSRMFLYLACYSAGCSAEAIFGKESKGPGHVGFGGWSLWVPWLAQSGPHE